jgi:flagellar motility protein MotE (MotC chaperone)
MMTRLMLLSVLTISFPVQSGNAEQDSKKTDAAHAEAPATAAAPGAAAKEAPANATSHSVSESGVCLASAELVQDLEHREAKIKEREASLVEREKEIEAQKIAIQEQLTKLETTRTEIQGLKGKQLADREEKVNRLIETFETMSPKSAAQVMSRIDEELATTALARLTTGKAGKILSSMDPAKSSRLSEMLALGRATDVSTSKSRKEAADADANNRSPASKK